MATSLTPNKSLMQPARGDDVGTWDTPVNGNMSIIDSAFGGSTILSSSSGTVNLTASQYQTPFWIISANSTATYVLPSGVGGLWTVDQSTIASGSVPNFTIGVSGILTSFGYESVTQFYSTGAVLRVINPSVSTVLNAVSQTQTNSIGAYVGVGWNNSFQPTYNQIYPGSILGGLTGNWRVMGVWSLQQSGSNWIATVLILRTS